MSKNVVTLKTALGSLKVIENDTIQSGTHDFLLTFYSNHRPISHCVRDKRQFPSKIAKKNSTPVYLAPRLKEFPLEFGIGAGLEETRMMELPEGGKVLR